MSYFKSILNASKDSDINDFDEGVLREMFKMCYDFFKDNEDSVSAMKYIALSYDKDSPLMNLTDRTEIKQKAERQSGLNFTKGKSILQNKNVEFNKIISFYLQETQPQAHNTIVTGKEILAENLAICREQLTLEDSKLDYEQYIRAMKGKADLFIRTIDIQNSLRELEQKVNLDDKNIHEISKVELEITPEMRLKMMKNKKAS